MAGFTKKGNIWYTTLRFNGKHYSITHRTSKEKEAKPKHDRIDKLESLVKDGTLTKDEFLEKIGRRKKKSSVRTVKSEFKEFLEFKKQKISPATIKMYLETEPIIYKVFGEDTDIHSLSSTDKTNFLKYIRTQKKPNRRTGELEQRWNTHSQNIKLRNLRCFLNWLDENDHINQVPFSVGLQRVPKKTKKYFKKNEFLKLVENTNEKFYKDVFVFAVNTGLRVGEINNCKLDGNYLIVNAETSKTRSERQLKLPQSLIPIYHEIRERGYTKGVYSKKVAKYRRVANLDESLTFHSFRHTYAIRTWLKYKDIRRTQIALGHASVTTTEIYTDVAPNFLKDNYGDWLKTDDNEEVCLELAFV